ncbi:hypothetical protein C9426_24890 [Serratia sp. S1B]|nr:hypothetical protein C9426_24890 [Serratia sp. S1B]
MKKTKSSLDKKIYNIKKLYHVFFTTSLCLPLMTHSALAASPSEIEQLLALEVPGTQLDCTYQFTLPESTESSTTADGIMRGTILSKNGNQTRAQVSDSYAAHGQVVSTFRYIVTSIYEPENKRQKIVIEPDTVYIEKTNDPQLADEIAADLKSSSVSYIENNEIELLSPLSYKQKSKDESISDMLCKYTLNNRA